MLKQLAVTAIIILALIILSPARAAAEAKDYEFSASAGILMDRDSRRILWAKEANKRLPIASTTKIMTAILALELGNEDDLIEISGKAASTEGSSIWLEEGEEKTLGELTYGLLLRSGNDAAVAIAEHLAGSVVKFSVLMNDKAREIGAHDSNFRNPHGLPDSNHFSTAYDLALIAAYALHNERFREIAATRQQTISRPGHTWGRYLSNQNRLLETYPGGDGVKTGWTVKAGRCFVGSATRDGWQLVSVVLNAPRMWEDTVYLLDYGFSGYNREKVLYTGQIVRTVQIDKSDVRLKIMVGRDFHYPLIPGERMEIRYRFNLDDRVMAPLKAGDELGFMEMYLHDEPIGRVELRAAHNLERNSIVDYIILLWSKLFD